MLWKRYTLIPKQSSTRIYRGDGRVSIFHELAAEDSSKLTACLMEADPYNQNMNVTVSHHLMETFTSSMNYWILLIALVLNTNDYEVRLKQKPMKPTQSVTVEVHHPHGHAAQWYHQILKKQPTQNMWLVLLK